MTHYLKSSPRSGQAMIIAVLAISGAIIGATSIAGLLLLYQIRATTDSVNSAKAIFAADTGVNWALYNYFQSSVPVPPPIPPEPNAIGDGATVTIACYDNNNNMVNCNNIASTTSARTEGDSNGNRRAFLVNLADATATLP